MKLQIWLVLFLACALTSCHKSGGGEIKAVEGGWQQFTNSEDGFVVELPTAPKTMSQQNNYDFGTVTIRAYTSNPRPNVDFRVATHNYPEAFTSKVTPKRLLDIMRDGMASNVKSKAEEVKEIKLGAHSGQEFQIQATDPATKKPIAVQVRLFVVGSRVYQLSATAPTGDEAAAKEATRFFGSFRLGN